MSKAKCKNCNTIIESVYRHDFVSCICRTQHLQQAMQFQAILDEFLSIGTNITAHIAAVAFDEVIGCGISIDGGGDYIKITGKLEHYEFIE